MPCESHKITVLLVFVNGPGTSHKNLMKVAFVLNDESSLPEFPDSFHEVTGQAMMDIVAMVGSVRNKLYVISMHSVTIHFAYQKASNYVDDEGDFVQLLAPVRNDPHKSVIVTPNFVDIRGADEDDIPDDLKKTLQSNDAIHFDNFVFHEHQTGVITKLDNSFMIHLWKSLCNALASPEVAM